MTTMASRLPDVFQHVPRVLRIVFCALLVLILLPGGSVNPVALHAFALGFFLIACIALLLGGYDRKVRFATSVALLVALLIGAWILVQAGVFGALRANPIWTDAVRIYGPMRSAISVAPGDTLEGLIPVLLPFAVFLGALRLFSVDENALGLIRAVVISGAVICLFGLFQFLLFPDTLFFSPKRYYLDSLTAVFVNRNTAATYFAMITIFAAGLAFHSLQNAGLRSFIRFLINSSNYTRRTDALLVAFYCAVAGLALVCLMMTQSRAGISSAIAALLLMAAIISYTGRPPLSADSRRGFGARRTSRWIKLLRTVVVLGVIIIVGLLLSGQAILRLGEQGTRDLRFCFFPSLLDMTRDNWLVGTGLTTFPDMFPAYRDPACGMDGVLNLAHNFYLEGWISLGLPFVIAAIIVVIALMVHMIEGIRSRRQYRWIPAAGLAALVLQLAHNSVDFSIQNPGVGSVFAALMAAAVVIARGRVPKARSRSSNEGSIASWRQDVAPPTVAESDPV